MKNSILTVSAMALIASATSCDKQVKYPAAPSDNTVDEYFGTAVADPYRPLENDTSATTLQWVEAENAVTNEYLSKIPFREALRKRIASFNNYVKQGLPWKAPDKRYYFYKNDGLKNQAVLYRTDSLSAEPEVFLDPNTLSDDGTVALTGITFSDNGRYAAYTISRNGSDWTEIYTLDTATGRQLDDHIEWAKFTDAAWCGDGFYYSAYDRPEAGKEFSNANENHRIYYHRMGTPQSADILVFEDRANPLHFHTAGLSSDERYLFVYTGGQGFGEGLMMKDLKKPGASSHPAVYALDGTKKRDIELPTLGTTGISASPKSDEVFYSFTSFLYPSTTFAYDKATGESSVVASPEVADFNPDDYVTEQVFYPSADGTKIPMFLTYKKGIERNGKNPVYLYGYGGFNISLPPSFSPNRLVWLENGGIYAQTNLRGGSEYGEEWHEAGTKMKKLNVFNDFIAAAEYLIAENWTSPEHIAIEGGSNGGLLVGAVTNMRPDLFRVAIPRVGVMDMMRYHLFTIGWNWASDYGTSADSKEMADYLLAYSPVHNIKNDGTPYPAIMVTTADHDDRVVPAHSFKYAAALQAADTGDRPKLIRIDSKAGHGGGKPVSKVIDEYTDIYSFIFYNLGITPDVYKQ